MNRAAAREAVRARYFFVANEEEAFSVFGRQEVQDINKIRKMTDIPCLVAFAVVVLIMMVLEWYAGKYGNVLRLSEPIDFQGRLCGFDEGVEDKPLGYNPNPYNDMVVCVSACPKDGADGRFTLPDGPMGKAYTRNAYPTARLLGQHCLPLDLVLARNIISCKDVQSEVYKALAPVFTETDVMSTIMSVPLVTSFIYLIMLMYVPSAAIVLAFASTSITLLLVGIMMDLDRELLSEIPLYKETHPLALSLEPYFRSLCFGGAAAFAGMLMVAIPNLARLHLVYRECMSAVITENVLVAVFAAMAVSIFRLMFIVHVCQQAAMLMSIINPVQVRLQLLGEWRVVERLAWSPYFLKGVAFYAFGTCWILEFLSFCSKYITAQVMCQNYFSLKAVNAQQQEIRAGKPSPLGYAVYSLVRYHLGSVALAALVSTPCQVLRFLILLFVPDRPNLKNSPNQQYRIAYYLFWPLIQLDLQFLRFFNDSVWVMLPLKGYKYFDAARRVEGLLNRCRGKIPNLSKFTYRSTTFLSTSVGLSTFFWTFFFYREPRHGAYHEVEQLDAGSSVSNLLETPKHSPLVVLPIALAFGLWMGNGLLHLIGMAADSLSVCYCIDVEMAGGTETEALYVPSTLRDVYKDLGGGESERELTELIAQSAQSI